MSLNDDEHLRAANERQLLKYVFIIGVIIGAAVMFWALKLTGQLKY